MPVYSLARAATEAGRSRSTLLRAIQTGRLSATRDATNGTWSIDASELGRAYPPGADGHGDRHGGTAGPHRVVDGGADRGDSALVAAKDALITEQRAMIDDLRRRLDTESEERRRLTLLLADQRAATPSASEPPRTAWRRFIAWRR